MGLSLGNEAKTRNHVLSLTRTQETKSSLLLLCHNVAWVVRHCLIAAESCMLLQRQNLYISA